jgi:hypothetical protein
MKLKCAAILVVLAYAMFGTAVTNAGQPDRLSADEVLRNWYGLSLELVRHTPTYSPPVASRAFAYMGVASYEVVASGSGDMQTLAGQLNGLQPGLAREANAQYDEAVVLQSAMAEMAKSLFANTGPTGQRALVKLESKLKAAASNGLPDEIKSRSETFGQALAKHILEWSQTDGGAVIQNMGFPDAYTLTKGPGHWVPTGPIRQQQLPLLPDWGKNRTFAMPDGTACQLPPPPSYSEEKASAFYAEALEVVDVRKNMTPEQKSIARFWSDDPMLSPTPPGHWISIASQIFERDHVPLEMRVDILARLGIAEADAFIGCWNAKFEYDLLRPVTYIRRTMDPKWESLMITPPFPEYPSGHSVQSAAAAEVLTHAFGDNFAFEDATHKKDGLPARRFASFRAAAEEAGISRLYGGIHFRSAITRGLEQGRCIAAFTNALKTKK